MRSAIQTKGEGTMTGKKLRKVAFSAIAIVMALVGSHITVSAQVSEGVERSIEGVWLVKVTPRNCTTGDPIPTAALEGIWTVYKDGTMLVSHKNNTPGLDRSPNHGLWRSDHGWSDYSFKYVHIRRSVATNLFAGRQEGGGTLVLNESGDEFTTDEWAIVYTVDGVPGTPFCINSVGTRFKLEP
jgi:hypothetical protein